MSWPVGSISDLAEVISGYAFKSSWFGAGNSRIIRIGDLQNGQVNLGNTATFDKELNPVSEQFKVRRGDILMALSGATVGKIAVACFDHTDVYLNQRVAIIRAKDARDEKYLKYVFSGKYLDKLLINAGGAAQPNLSPKDLSNMEIPVPDMTERLRIAAILDQADGLRRKRQQAIELADTFLRSVFLEMFGDPVTNPKGWKQAKLASLSKEKMQNGAYFPKEEYSDDGVEMVHMSDVFYDLVERGRLKRVNAKQLDLEKYSLTHKDILISRRSLTYEGAAKPSLIPEAEEPLLFESSMIRFKPDESRVNKIYLFHYLSNHSVKEHFIRKFVTGATIKGINQKNLEEVRCLLPPLHIQNEFEKIVTLVNEKKGKYTHHFRLPLFESLSQKLFSGAVTSEKTSPTELVSEVEEYDSEPETDAYEATIAEDTDSVKQLRDDIATGFALPLASLAMVDRSAIPYHGRTQLRRLREAWDFHLTDVDLAKNTEVTAAPDAQNLAALRQTIATVFGLPLEAIHFVEPSGSRAHGRTKVGTLRSYWQ